MNCMFWPGGFDGDKIVDKVGDDIDDSEILEELDHPEKYLSCAPTFPGNWTNLIYVITLITVFMDFVN